MVWSWHMPYKILKVQDSFSSSAIPHLISEAFWKVVLYTCVIVNGAGLTASEMLFLIFLIIYIISP